MIIYYLLYYIFILYMIIYGYILLCYILLCIMHIIYIIIINKLFPWNIFHAQTFSFSHRGWLPCRVERFASASAYTAILRNSEFIGSQPHLSLYKCVYSMHQNFTPCLPAPLYCRQYSLYIETIIIPLYNIILLNI